MAKVSGGRKKTVSFSSMPSEKKVSSAADCLAFMQGGCELKKVRPNSRIYSRFYTLDTELACLRWEPSKKDGDRARLDISTIREVRTGKSTETFIHNGPLDHLPEEAAFSIIHGDEYQSLDLVALSADVANIWVTGMRYLLSHPGAIGGGSGGDGGVGEGSIGSKMRRNWLVAEFALVDEDGHGIVSEDTAVATICKLCPGIKEAKVTSSFIINYINHNNLHFMSKCILKEPNNTECKIGSNPKCIYCSSLCRTHKIRIILLSKSREK